MKLLVIGSGGREHALVWKLAQSPHATAIWCAPGNPGIAQERLFSNGELVHCGPVAADDLKGIVRLAREIRSDLIIVGPDNPLALGLVDLGQEEGFRTWGPTKMAAQFEWSKAFAQDFMERHGIPTARAGTFTDPELARLFAASLDGRCAVKADGLALGKGVIVASNLPEAWGAIDQMLVQKVFGEAGGRIVIQEFLTGTEISLHLICDGNSAKLFPPAQDHKRALDGNGGANTGGMGAYCPAPFLTNEELSSLRQKVVEPWLKGCRMEGISFRGILYPGLILTRDGPKVIEFNVRFGDPEAQVYLPRLKTDLIELIDASLSGGLEKLELAWEDCATLCVIMASAGYPGSYQAGHRITGLEEANRLPQSKVFQAGTRQMAGGLATAGGRVLGVTAWGRDLGEARTRAYAAVEKIQFDGAHFRHDIGNEGLRYVQPRDQVLGKT